MGKIKGWEKSGINSWRNRENENLILEIKRSTYGGINFYGVVVISERTDKTLKRICDTQNTLEDARYEAIEYMRKHSKVKFRR